MRFKISTKLITVSMLTVILMVSMAAFLIYESQKSLKESVGENYVSLAEEMLKRMNEGICLKVGELQTHSRHSVLRKSLSESNRKFQKLADIEAYIKQKDREWVSAPKDEITPFMQGLISGDLSDHFREDFIEFYQEKYGYKIILEMFVTNKYGANVAQSGKTSDYRQDDEKWWQIAREKGYHVGAVEFDESTGENIISIGVRIDDKRGDFIGVMKAEVALKSIVRSAEIAVKKYETTRIKLITKDGRLIYSTRAFKFLEDISDKNFFKQIKGQKGFFIGKYGGRERLYSYARSKGYRDFEGLGWILVVGHDVQEILKPAFQLRNRMMAVSLLLISLVVIVAFLISRSITSPIKKLIIGTQKLGQGDLEHRVTIKAKDETGELAAAFNEMAENRLKVETALQKSDERYRTVADFTYDWEYWIDTDGHFRYISPSCERITGYAVEEFLNNPDLMVKVIHPKDIDLVSKHYQDELTDSEPHSIEFRIVTKNGEGRWMSHVCQQVYGKNGIKLGRRASNRDITDQKQADEELKAYMFKLEAANKELEAFSYSVSHDLRVPLRIADGFSQILLEEYSDILDEKAKHYIERVRVSSQNMAELIDDILNLSRIGRQSMEKKETNVETIAGKAYESLEPEWKNRKVNFAVHQCPPAFSDPNLTQIVFKNLLSNALKFTKNRKEAEIEVGCETRDKQTAFFVKDNGAGFDMKYADKLFAPFQRLHPAAEYEGTGIGLSIVQRIIRRHDGHIWAESSVGKGTTFFFTL